MFNKPLPKSASLRERFVHDISETLRFEKLKTNQILIKKKLNDQLKKGLI